MGQKIATEQVIADLPDGRTVIIANPGEVIPDVPVLGYVEGGPVSDANVIDSQTLKGGQPAADAGDGDGASTEPQGPLKFEGNKDALIAALTDDLGVKDFDKKAKREDLEEIWRKAVAEREEQEKSLTGPPNDKSLGPDAAENK